jgi:hypothetical protein
LAAEREVFRSIRHRLSADRTFQLELLFARHRSIVDGKPGGRSMQLRRRRCHSKLRARRMQPPLSKAAADSSRSWPIGVDPCDPRLSF